ncbi:MAG: L-threonylcarbamoyladenylate synthase [Nitrospirae bacterium]|nr:L-threonylcarbamoyladenylate synthase [Nitrospirota bacterium]
MQRNDKQGSIIRKGMPMNPKKLPEDDIQAAVVLLRAGETVAFPTETVYGLGADARNPLAVQKIFWIKGRPADHPLIVHIADVSHLDMWAENISGAVWRLAESFWPGPLTLILPRRRDVPKDVSGGQDTIGLRIPDHPVAASLLRAFGGGIAAPSANRFGRVSPTTAQHVRDGLGSKVGMILEGGPCRVGVESTIVSLVNGNAVLLRPGGISLEEIEDTLGQKVFSGHSGSGNARVPGMLASHYAPATPLEIHPGSLLGHRALQLVWQGCKVAVVTLREDGECFESRRIITTCMPRSAAEYGRVLYSTLHRLDRAGFDRLLIEAPPVTPEWLAVNDRIQRAAHGTVKGTISGKKLSPSSGEVEPSVKEIFKFL